MCLSVSRRPSPRLSHKGLGDLAGLATTLFLLSQSQNLNCQNRQWLMGAKGARVEALVLISPCQWSVDEYGSQ